MAICLYNGTLLSGFSVMEQCAVLIEDGKIADVFSQKRFEKKHFEPDTRLFDVQGAYIAPGFIDTHIHGFKGHGTEDVSCDSILAMSKDLADYGVSAFNPTLYSSDEETFIKEYIQSFLKIGCPATFLYQPRHIVRNAQRVFP